MGRWEPNARGRLEAAALDLYTEVGFEQTTVAQIAARAGLTERTFFRHFADKREVLFWGRNALEETVVDTIAGLPESVGPFDAAAEGLAAPATLFEVRRDLARKRQAVIAANPALRERELIKLASLGSAVAEALHRRGVPDPAAVLAAEAAIAAFKIAFERWIAAPDDRRFAQFVRESVDELKAVTAGRPATAASSPN